MVTYLVGTDGIEASTVTAEFLAGTVDGDDSLEVINVLPESADADERNAGERALDRFVSRIETDASITTRQLCRGKGPTDAIIDHAEEVDADRIVIALRRHTRTERIVFGSISHSLLQKVRRPVTLVPLPEYQPDVD